MLLKGDKRRRKSRNRGPSLSRFTLDVALSSILTVAGVGEKCLEVAEGRTVNVLGR